MTYEDPNTRYLFYPEEVVLVADNDFRKYAYDMKKYKLVKRVLNDVAHWYELCRVIVSEHDGKLLGLFIDSEYDAHVIYQKLKNDKWEYTKGHFLPKYMVLGDDKIYPMWFILLKSCGIPLRNLEKVPMPITDEIIRLFNITGITESSDSAVVSELQEDISEQTQIDKLKAYRQFVNLYNVFCKKYYSRHKCSGKDECPIGEFCKAESIE